MVPPPPQPDFASVFSSGAIPPRNVPGREANNVRPSKPWQAAEIAAARQRRMSQTQTQAQTSQHQATNRQPLLTPTKLPPPKLASPFQPRTSNQAQASVRTNTGSPSPNHSRQRSRDYIAPSAHFNNKHLRNNSGSASIASQNSANSSLLTKRLGIEKASALQLHTNKAAEEKQQAKWRVLDQEEREAARDPGWRPQLAKFDGMGKEKRTVVRARDIVREDGLPRTPGWVPKLTPTRRGDELFLSVA